MEEVLYELSGDYTIEVFHIKKTKPVSIRSFKVTIESEKQLRRIINDISKYRKSSILFYKNECSVSRKLLNDILIKPDVDGCIISNDNVFYVRGGGLYASRISNQAVVVLHQHGIEKMTLSNRESYEDYYFFIPIGILILFLYFVERGVASREKEDGGR